jgi:ATP synthase protein I
MTKLGANQSVQNSRFKPEASDEDDFVPLTREQVQALKHLGKNASPWPVVRWQAAMACGVAVAAYAVGASASAVWSVVYGGLAVVLPSALFARGIWRQRGLADAGAVFAGFVVWEVAKVVLTIAMLCAAPAVIAGLHWPAMLLAFVLTMKVSLVVLWRQSKATTALV